MAEECLRGPDVASLLQKVRRERVTEGRGASRAIQDQLFRPPTLVCQSIEHLDDAEARQGRVHLAGETASAERVHDVEALPSQRSSSRRAA